MNGIRSYEDILKNPGISIIDWEYLSIHPEAKYKIIEKYVSDPMFKMKVNQKLSTDSYFKMKFNNYFSDLMSNEEKKRRM